MAPRALTAALFTALALGAAAPGHAIAAASGAVQPMGGTITFTGAIVAPPFDVSVGGTQTGVTAGAGAFATRASASGATVTFATPSGGEPHATVALSSPMGLPQHDVAGRFVDTTGRTQRADGAEAYHVGAQGGVLSLEPSAVSRRAAPVQVVVSYD
jgi:type 1 fimbria pilin